MKAIALCSRCVRVIGWVMTISLLAFAVFVSLARYFLPTISQHKSWVEQQLSTQLLVDVRIRDIQAEWRAKGPSLVISDIEIYPSDNSDISISLETLVLDIDIWKSFFQRTLASSRFELIAPELIIDIDSASHSRTNERNLLDLTQHLFLSQLQHFSVTDGHLTLRKDGDEQRINIESLLWFNREDRHQGRGTMQIESLTHNQLSFVIDLQGVVEQFNGVFFVDGNDIDISPWLHQFLKTPQPLKESLANFSFWIEFDELSIKGVQAQLHNTYLTWENEAQLTSSASLQAIPVADGWSFRIDELRLEAEDVKASVDLVGMLDEQGGVTFNLVKPAPLAPFFSLVPLFYPSLDGSQWDPLLVEGEVEILQLYLPSKKPPLAYISLHDLGWQEIHMIPGVNGVDVDIDWYGDRGSVQFVSTNTQMSAKKLLGKSHEVERLSGNIYLDANCISTPQLLMRLSSLSLETKARYCWSNHFLSMTQKIGTLPQRQASDFFPKSLMGENTSRYLTRALEGEGKIVGAEVIWHGELSSFPFSDGTGIFQTSVSLEDASFLFSSRWPLLQAPSMRLLFENEQLTINAASAKLMSIALTDISAVIPALRSNSEVNISAKADASGEALGQLLLNSSVDKSLGALFSDDILIQGALSADLSISVPFSGENVTVGGAVQLDGPDIFFPKLDLRLDSAIGHIVFSNDDVSGTSIKANWLEQALDVKFDGEQTPQGYRVVANVNGHSVLTSLLNTLSLSIPVEGSTDWQLDLSMLFPTNDFSYTASLQSSLEGVISELPLPFGKAAGVTMPLRLLAEGDKQASKIMLDLGSEVSFEGALPHESMQFSRSHLAIGDGLVQGMGMGLSVSYNLPTLAIERWIELLQPLRQRETKTSLFTLPERLFITTKRLEFAEQALVDADITAKQKNGEWHVDVRAKQTKGTLDWVKQADDYELVIAADFLKFTQNQQKLSKPIQPTSSLPSIPNIPSITFTCQQCYFDKLDLGKVSMRLNKQQDTLFIEQLDIVQSVGSLSANGRWWEGPDGEQYTEFEGRLSSKDAGALLQQLEFDTGIKDSSADLNFTLGWWGQPWQPHVDSLNGGVKWSLTDGYLSELSDKGSRIFTLFSLSSLIRKLSLDFRDVFAKGFFYDQMSGTLRVEDGLVTTEDTKIDGGAGEIFITGESDLVNRTLNYNVNFTPNVTGNLPFLVYFLATPQTALAALALDRVLTSAKVISNINYQVSGTFDKPLIDEVKRASKDVELPAKATPKLETSPVPEDNLQPMRLQTIDG